MNHPGLISDRAIEIAAENGCVNNEPSQDDTARARFEISVEIKAAFILSGSNNARYLDLKEYPENRFAVAQADEYLRITVRLLGTMNNFHVTKRQNSNDRERFAQPPSIDSGVNFVQEGEDKPDEVHGKRRGSSNAGWR